MLSEEKIAEYADASRNARKSSETVEQAKQKVIDTIGCALGALNSTPVKLLKEMGDSFGSKGISAHVWGTNQTMSPDNVSFVNSAAARYLDYNDIYLGKHQACHPSDNLPGAWAVAESTGKSGQEFLNALCVGYEINCMLTDSGALDDRGFDNLLYGAISSSVMASLLLDLPYEKIVEAIRIAGSSTISLFQTRIGQLSMWKGLAAGYACKSGVYSAYLAKHGITGPKEIFEGKFGIIKVLSPDFSAFNLDSSAFTRITQTRLKRYPAQYFMQTTIEAALKIQEKIEDYRSIGSIEVETFSRAIKTAAGDESRWSPTTRETADHSLPYCITMSFLNGDLTAESFEREQWNDERVKEFLPKVKATENRDFSSNYPDLTQSTVKVSTKDGGKYSEHLDVPTGDPRRPFTKDVLETKFMQLGRRFAGEDAIKGLLAKLWRLEKLETLPGILN